VAHQDLELAYWAFGHLQRDNVEGFLSYVDPEAEWHSYLPEVEGTFHGHEGVREWWSTLRGVVLDSPPLIEEARDLGEWILLGARVEAGRASGSDFWQIMKVPERQITHCAAFPSSEGALEAAGRPE
jgi:SnoaL-like domain